MLLILNNSNCLSILNQPDELATEVPSSTKPVVSNSSISISSHDHDQVNMSVTPKTPNRRDEKGRNKVKPSKAPKKSKRVNLLNFLAHLNILQWLLEMMSKML
jgi:hypothetical protein